MSWGNITAIALPDKLEDALRAAAEAYEVTLQAQDYELDTEAKAQIAVAIHAAVAIAKTGVAGKLPGVNLTGHANPGHNPKAGWGADSVSLFVYDTSKASPAVTVPPTV